MFIVCAAAFVVYLYKGQWFRPHGQDNKPRDREAAGKKETAASAEMVNIQLAGAHQSI